MRKTLTMLTLAAAMLAAEPAIVPAVTYLNSEGHAVERGSLHGTVVQVDQNRRTFMLHWGGIKYPGRQGGTHEQTFRVTDQTVYKNGSWANIVKGAVVKITGHSDVVDTVKFGK
jgi:hypothetical protein